MKNLFRILFFGFVAVLSTGFVACSDDEFTDTIFDTNPAIDYLDKTAYTFPLDTFVKKEFLEPYNLKFIYKFEDKGSDMNKNLTPAAYDKCVDLAVLTKYLWYDIYKDLAGVEFLKAYSPRIIHVCGSKNYNPSQGTETLGDASSGIKINLYNVNNLDPNDIDLMNEYFFKTMHHEFAHILDQTYLHPTTFNTISNSQYDASGWSDSPDSLKAGLGFTSSYASSAVGEDWAETLANYITRDTLSWEKLLNTASYEWELVDCDDYNAYRAKLSPGCNLDTIGYYKEADNGENKIYRRKCVRNADDRVVLSSVTRSVFAGTQEIKKDNPWKIPVTWSTVKAGTKLKITAEPKFEASESTFDLINGSSEAVYSNLKWDFGTITMTMDIDITQEVLDKINASTSKSLTVQGEGFIVKKVELYEPGEPEWLHETGIDGRATILRKVDLAREYLRTNYNISLDELRHAVQTHTYATDAEGNFIMRNGRLVNNLTNPAADGSILIEQLRNLVEQYKAFQK